MDTPNTNPSPGKMPGEQEPAGRLIVRVFTARGGIPIKDALVTISSADPDVPSPYAVLTTDSSGRTPTISLPAPPQSLSLSPSDESVYPALLPYSLYTVRIEREGFYTITNLNVRIFAGITAIQDADLIPRAEALPRGFYLDDSTYIDGGGKNGL